MDIDVEIISSMSDSSLHFPHVTHVVPVPSLPAHLLFPLVLIVSAPDSRSSGALSRAVSVVAFQILIDKTLGPLHFPVPCLSNS